MSGEPGWYPDPGGRGWRWWDGVRWTYHQSDVPPYAPQAPRQHQSSSWAGPITLFLGIILAGLIGIGIILVVREATEEKTVTYRVKGSAQVDITYGTLAGEEQLVDVATPKMITVTAKSGEPVVLLAQNKLDSGFVECIIEQNGRELVHRTSVGGFAVVSCSTTAR